MKLHYNATKLFKEIFLLVAWQLLLNQPPHPLIFYSPSLIISMPPSPLPFLTTSFIPFSIKDNLVLFITFFEQQNTADIFSPTLNRDSRHSQNCIYI